MFDPDIRSATRSSYEQAAADSSQGKANLKNMLLLIQLRWIAVIGQIITIVIVEAGFGIDLPLLPMALLLTFMLIFNAISSWSLRHRSTLSTQSLLHALMLDVIALSIQLALSGGISNPFVGLYLLQITLAAVLLNLRAAWSVVCLATACLLLLIRFYRPLDLTLRAPTDMANLQLIGMLVCYALDAGLLVLFITRITRNLRQRDDHLAALRQRAAEEDHIVRMGLLASGAAHELGTPLSSVAVILGDWRRMPTVADQPELLADIDEMQAALQRCKTIVTGILVSSGEARGESSSITTLRTFITRVIHDWQAARPSAGLTFTDQFGKDEYIVSDTTIQQLITNLLDNAYEVSPKKIKLHLLREQENLVIEVHDAGPGFADDMLRDFGKPYRSTKDQPGRGLGLFLVTNVARKLGGSVHVSNLDQDFIRQGAMIKVVLPLAAVRVGEPDHD